METTRAYDLPLRIFHWLFAALFIFSFTIGKIVDDESTIYVYHMLSGFMMVGLLIFRVIWGGMGSKTSRFNCLKLKSSDLQKYFVSMVCTRTKRYLGHNPASSYAALSMFILTLLIAGSGVMMSLRIKKHFFEEAHELFVNSFLILVILHLVGLALHQISHRDGMLFSMINGKKAKIKEEGGIKSNHPLAAGVLLVYIVFTGTMIWNRYDSNSGKFNAFGVILQLGEQDQPKMNSGENDDHDDYDD